MTRTVAFCLTTRSQYARVKTALTAIRDDPEMELELLLTGAGVVRKYGSLQSILEDDGLEVSRSVQNVVEGGNLASQSKTTGLAMVETTTWLREVDPDVVMITGDRYEIMAIALPACYLNVPIVHLEGGEITGSVDDKVRHATTKFSDYHFVSTDRASKVVRRLGEDRNRVFKTGCPSIDIADRVRETDDSKYDPQEEKGVGAYLDVTEEFIVVQYHPVPTEYGDQYEKTWTLIDALDRIDVQKFWFWPNMDGGTDMVSKAMREFRGKRDPDDVHFLINLPPEEYLTLVNNSECMVGNSSVGIRECSYLGKPAVNIGERQRFRERAGNVTDVACEEGPIHDAVVEEIPRSYESSSLYGDGGAGGRIAELTAGLDVEQKGSMDPAKLGLATEMVN
jgi:UDP-hydrolysing UDP-N-acetyl-D-glucosamine 2-epimerase